MLPHLFYEVLASISLTAEGQRDLVLAVDVGLGGELPSIVSLLPIPSSYVLEPVRRTASKSRIFLPGTFFFNSVQGRQPMTRRVNLDFGTEHFLLKHCELGAVG